MTQMCTHFINDREQKLKDFLGTLKLFGIASNKITNSANAQYTVCISSLVPMVLGPLQVLTSSGFLNKIKGFKY